MRPIDADALIKKLDILLDIAEGREWLGVSVSGGFVEQAPTIDVIPIDWMKNKIEEHRDNPFQDVYDAFQTVMIIWRHETEGKR